ncbi:MAG TPA: FHA domain-containing protein, partial [Vicinamibacterales bacterium]|nr:FHA domain-containing protein [Vicinamibacterales bacterium]
VYHVYLHPEEFSAIEPIAPRIVAEVQRALTNEIEKINQGLERSGRRVLARLLQREDLPPIEVPASGWEINIQADRNGELTYGQLGIVSTLALPAPTEYSGTPTTRIVKSVVASGRRTSTTTDVEQPSAPASHRTTSAERGGDAVERARLRYTDEQGPHEFVMRKDTLAVGRGGSSAWVDVQVVASSKVSREHFRIRRDASGQFLIQDVSLWGTSVNGEPLAPAMKGPEGVIQPGAEQPLPPRARIELADALVMEFEASPDA